MTTATVFSFTSIASDLDRAASRKNAYINTISRLESELAQAKNGGSLVAQLGYTAALAEVRDARLMSEAGFPHVALLGLAKAMDHVTFAKSIGR